MDRENHPLAVPHMRDIGYLSGGGVSDCVLLGKKLDGRYSLSGPSAEGI